MSCAKSPSLHVTWCNPPGHSISSVSWVTQGLIMPSRKSMLSMPRFYNSIVTVCAEAPCATTKCQRIRIRKLFLKLFDKEAKAFLVQWNAFLRDTSRLKLHFQDNFEGLAEGCSAESTVEQVKQSYLSIELTDPTIPPLSAIASMEERRNWCIKLLSSRSHLIPFLKFRAFKTSSNQRSKQWTHQIRKSMKSMAERCR